MGEIKLEKFASYNLMILFGVLLVFLPLFKLLGVYDISSDWFWFIAGAGLAVEGSVYLVNQKRFDRKYKILTKEEYEQLKNKA